MKGTSILLASQRKPLDGMKGHQRLSSADFDEDDWELQYDLRKPDQILIADDTNGYHLFGDVIFVAPQEDILEG